MPPISSLLTIRLRPGAALTMRQRIDVSLLPELFEPLPASAVATVELTPARVIAVYQYRSRSRGGKSAGTRPISRTDSRSQWARFSKEAASRHVRPVETSVPSARVTRRPISTCNSPRK